MELLVKKRKSEREGKDRMKPSYLLVYFYPELILVSQI